MADVLQHYRKLCGSLEDATRWACAIEAIAPKLGNVHPAACFDDLTITHFLSAGEILAHSIETCQTLGKIVLTAVGQSQKQFGTNINLGISLLIAPLALARRRGVEVSQVLSDLTAQDAADVYAAIALANPGGMGRSEQMDIHQQPPASLLAAMQVSRNRDLIAKQYSDNFCDIFEIVIPAILAGIDQEGDMLLGVRRAQIMILAKLGDSLIERKCGSVVATEVRRRAAEIVILDDSDTAWKALREFDCWMREDGNRRNPGATADLIAAGLFELFCGV